ncbi:hypothetical protein FA15DRAFT_101863 [Coprinopsis marcescibilis]|uniref:Transmembrane protein n=1 Tax=Coprinopsis marcescibilis TaxID=230819 RepID=A0A5C3KL03_COPMA|nr:hypothetical protein FA15DRAFT_101863 [Coprinopsis marcescibilis]
MPNAILTIEDDSPLIAYSGTDWLAGTREDPSISRYSGGSYMRTNETNGRATFTFYGSEVHFFGARRSTYGFYQFVVNGTPTSPGNAGSGNAGSSANDVFQSDLTTTSVRPVTNSRNIIVLQAGSDTGVDIDAISWKFPVGNDDEPLIVNTYQENHPAFSYSSDSAWRATPVSTNTFSGGSARNSSEAGSSFTFNFEGAAVSLYGPVGPGCARYIVVADSESPEEFVCQRTFYRNNMLYHRAGFGPGKHSLTVTLGREGGFFIIDSAQVWTAPSLGGSFAGGSGGSTSKSETLSVGAGVGIGIGALFGVLLLLGLLGWFLLKRSAKRQNRTLHFGFMPKPEREGQEKWGAVLNVPPVPFGGERTGSVTHSRNASVSRLVPHNPEPVEESHSSLVHNTSLSSSQFAHTPSALSTTFTASQIGASSMQRAASVDATLTEESSEPVAVPDKIRREQEALAGLTTPPRQGGSSSAAVGSPQPLIPMPAVPPPMYTADDPHHLSGRTTPQNTPHRS